MKAYCSATCTSPLAPTSAHSERIPSRSGAGGVSASTGTPARHERSGVSSGVTGHGTLSTTKSGRSAASRASTVR